jgi:hypothetical protein
MARGDRLSRPGVFGGPASALSSGFPLIGTASCSGARYTCGIGRGYQRALGRPCHIEGTQTSADGRQSGSACRCKARSPASPATGHPMHDGGRRGGRSWLWLRCRSSLKAGRSGTTGLTRSALAGASSGASAKQGQSRGSSHSAQPSQAAPGSKSYGKFHERRISGLHSRELIMRLGRPHGFGSEKTEPSSALLALILVAFGLLLFATFSKSQLAYQGRALATSNGLHSHNCYFAKTPRARVRAYCGEKG